MDFIQDANDFSLAKSVKCIPVFNQHIWVGTGPPAKLALLVCLYKRQVCNEYVGQSNLIQDCFGNAGTPWNTLGVLIGYYVSLGLLERRVLPQFVDR